MSILFHHKRNVGINKFFAPCIEALGGTTVAIEQPKSWILPTLKVGEFFDKKVGIAKCSDEDRYNKKLGREIAVSRMKPVRLTVKRIVSTDAYTQIEFISDVGSHFIFRKYSSANEVFFVDYEE
jgi:hypothetical protein